MRKVVVSQYVSLDGVIENPMWTFPYWSDEIANFKHAELFASDSLLLGRVTYAAFAEAWPPRTDEAGYAQRINALPKAVPTTTLDELEWNATAIKGDLKKEINKLKVGPGGDILLYGSGKLMQSLMELDLIDQYNLLYYPLVLGKGQKLFEDGREAKLKLVKSIAFDTGVIGLIYEPDRAA
jgi:dihydrofolate reductase